MMWRALVLIAALMSSVWLRPMVKDGVCYCQKSLFDKALR